MDNWKYVADLVTEFDPNLPPIPCLAGELETRLARAQKMESVGQLDLSSVIEHCQRLIEAIDEGTEESVASATGLLRKSLYDVDVECLVEEIRSAIK